MLYDKMHDAGTIGTARLAQSTSFSIQIASKIELRARILTVLTFSSHAREREKERESGGGSGGRERQRGYNCELHSPIFRTPKDSAKVLGTKSINAK